MSLTHGLGMKRFEKGFCGKKITKKNLIVYQ
jgi:hypothetical protein